MDALLDREGVIAHFNSPPERVVSLVPSVTESLFDLGLGGSVVGITEFCIHPAAQLTGLPRLGGPKNPAVDQIIALKPNLVFANQEENTPLAIQALADAGVPVWLNFPQTVQAALETLWTIVAIFHSRPAAMRLDTLQRAADWASASAGEIPPWTYFCPIWQSAATLTPESSWWMTFNQQTYMADLLRLFGGTNIFSNRIRRYPLEADLGLAPGEDALGRDTRYPRVTAGEISAAAPDMILLPDEPYAFQEANIQAFSSLFPTIPAIQNQRVLLVDGSLLTWHGTRLGKALQDLPTLLGMSL